MAVSLLFAIALAVNRGDDPVWTAVNDTGQLLAAVIATGSAVVAARRTTRRERVGWAIIAAGSSMWSAGQAIWTYYEVVLAAEVPSPGLADIGFIAAPVLWIVGLLLFVDTPAGLRTQISGLLEGLMIAGGFFLPTWIVALAPVVRDSTDTIGQQLVNLAYPVFDIFVLATVLFGLTRRRVQTRGSLPLMALGMAAIAIADSSFWYLNSADEYLGINFFDLGWFGGFLVLALGSIHVRAPGAGDSIFHRSRWILSIPNIVYVGGIIVSIVSIGRPNTVFGPFEQTTLVSLVAIGLVHRLAVQAENHSLTVGLESRVRERTVELEGRERYFAALVRSSSDVITVIDADGTIRSVSASVGEIYGYDHAQFFDAPIGATAPFDRLLPVIEQAVADPGRVHRLEWQLVDSSGVDRIAESTVSNLLADPDIGRIVVNTRDVTDRASLETQLRHEAFHDPLTGLPNRALFADRVAHALTRHANGGRRLGIAMIDLDGFKGVNDSHGHHAGDRVLQSVAEELAATLRDGETIARLGGDEFAILVEDIGAMVDPTTIATRILEALRVTVDVNGTRYEVAASVGLAMSSSPLDGDTVESLLRDADIAMYSAKRDGPGVARVFRPEMRADVQHRFALHAELREAIARDEMVLHYQPTYSLATNRISGFEALIRWQHPERGLLAPVHFIAIAEETGLIVPIGEWVLRTAVQQLHSWSREFVDGGELTMAVNVSVGQLRAPGLFELVRTVLAEEGMDPRRLVLEITESMLISEIDDVPGLLGRLADLGVRIAIDDFGTGYASLANLQSLPLDVLKIDRSFVSQNGQDGAALLSTILDIGRALGLETIGEGIEDEAQLAVLRNGGCDLGQGYFLARPLAADAARALLLEGRPEVPRERVVATTGPGAVAPNGSAVGR